MMQATPSSPYTSAYSVQPQAFYNLLEEYARAGAHDGTVMSMQPSGAHQFYYIHNAHPETYRPQDDLRFAQVHHHRRHHRSAYHSNHDGYTTVHANGETLRHHISGDTMRFKGVDHASQSAYRKKRNGHHLHHGAQHQKHVDAHQKHHHQKHDGAQHPRFKAVASEVAKPHTRTEQLRHAAKKHLHKKATSV
jgi:hypothetical protein